MNADAKLDAALRPLTARSSLALYLTIGVFGETDGAGLGDAFEPCWRSRI
jgi:hypothetical protein